MSELAARRIYAVLACLPIARAIGLGAALSALACLPARAEYTIQEGDTIEVAVAGLPELRQKVTVQADGAIALPLAGAVKVEGLTPAELRLEVQRQLARKIYRLRAADGREVLVVIQPEEISAAIAAYRPVYVTGDVGKPGELTFRPEMTARQAVALAGGADLLSNRSANPLIEMATLKGEHDVLLVELAAATAKAARIEAELEGETTLAKLDLSDLPLPNEKRQEIQDFEASVLQARMADADRERKFLQATVDRSNEQVAAFAKLLAQQNERARGDAANLLEMIDSFGSPRQREKDPAAAGPSAPAGAAIEGQSDAPAAAFTRIASPFMESATLKGEYDGLSVELAAASAKVARLNAELNGQDGIAKLDLSDIRIPGDKLADIVKNETTILQARNGDFARERAFLQATIDQSDDRTAVVEKLQKEEEQGTRADTAELQKLVDLLSKGQETSPRVTEARRALLLSSTRTLQISVELLELKRKKNEAVRQLQQFIDNHRIELLKELEAAVTSEATLRVTREAAAAKLRHLADAPAESVNVELVEQYRSRSENLRKLERFEDERRVALLKDKQDAATAVATMRAKRRAIETRLQLLANARAPSDVAENAPPIIRLIRQNEGRSTKTIIDGDFKLAPGDVIEVSLRAPRGEGESIR